MINTVRFCHTSPHIFVTASYDHSCKVWDLRQPLISSRSIKNLITGDRNVMCTFSPDDTLLLRSGVDTQISQFEVPSWHPFPERFPFRESVHEDRYRRSAYFASGRHFATAATE